ncbi:hypothetical protein [Sapientia aquatica]|uniref:Uncharacterized protein n=1 Tax=Sapientia aquatica TaxID=1549640 RepID=A0A4R5W4N0_9BURK|nr:hypothetical protein [Sapientia aquatica]TDK68047.1 hypothetical protein E2I14_00360 [Sapientia aquatica]
MTIKGINKAIEEPNTGSIANFHRIEYFSIDLRSKYVSMIVRGYVSEDTCDSGRLHIMETNVSISDAPTLADNIPQFLYNAITAVAPEPEVDPTQPNTALPVNVFAGGVLVGEVTTKPKK